MGAKPKSGGMRYRLEIMDEAREQWRALPRVML